MSSILGFNIGGNPRGILNLGSTINTPLSATLQSVTDGMGVASPLQLSTTQVAIGIGALANGVLSIKTTQANTNGTIAFLNNGAATIAAITDSGSALTPMIFRATEYRFTDATGLVIGRGYTDSASARLHVRGDGTNPIGRFEDNSGLQGLQVEASRAVTVFTTLITPAIAVRGTEITVGAGGGAGNTGVQFNISALSAASFTSGNGGALGMSQSVTMAAGSGNWRGISSIYTINNSGAQTGTATGIFLNATETALNGMGHNLIDLQVGGVSRFRIDNGGALFVNFLNIANDIRLVGNIRLSSTGDGILNLFNNLSNNFNRLNFGGTTNAFCALKRSSTTLDVRLADDSAFTNVRGKLTTETNHTGTADVACNGYLTLYDATGTAYKVMTTA